MSRTFDTADQCAEAIIAAVGRDITLAVPIGIGKPNLLVNALYRRAAADRSIRLRIFTGLTLVRPRYKTDLERRFVEPLLDRLFPTWPELDYTAAQRKGTLPPNIEVHEFFLQAGVWLGNASVQQSYASLNYSHVAAHLQRIGTNVLAQLVAPPRAGVVTEGDARVSLGSNTDVTLDLTAYVEARRKAGLPIIVAGEINGNLPYMTGEAEIPRAEFDVILDPPQPHYDLFAPPKEPVSLADYAMALHAATLVKDGGTLQIGIGSFADALTHALILRHTRNREFGDLVKALGAPLHPDAELGTFEQGLYGCSEMLVDGFLALKRAGILKRKVRGEHNGTPYDAVLHAGFFVGSAAFYRELRAMPPEELGEIAMTAISFTNTLRGDAAAKTAERRDARFINTAMTATLLGAVSSDQLEDGRVVSGIGGQGDFVAMAHEIPGARSIIAVRSTRRGGRGKETSNIVWRYGNTTVPRPLRDIVITEYGIADIRGLSDGEVVQAMLAVADKSFHASLQAEATKAGKLRRDFTLPPQARSNSAQKIEAALGAAHRSGLLPAFPQGTDMTDIEQSLITPLGRLRTGSIPELLSMLGSGLAGGPRTAHEHEALARLDLASPASLKMKLTRALVLGALRR
jgi:acyl-CoA hydrolase